MSWTHRIVPPGWLLLAVLACGALHHWLPLHQLLTPPLNWIGLPPLLAGFALTARGVLAFRRAGTSVVPFQRSARLVTTGIYRVTRNPMYLGITLILAGVAGLLGSLGAFLPLAPFVWILQDGYIHAEERFLEEIFGSEYLKYKTDVRRWL